MVGALSKHKLLGFAGSLIATFAAFVTISAVHPQKAAAVLTPCTLYPFPGVTNQYPRANTGLREEFGCTPSVSWIWLSSYSEGVPDSPVHTPNAVVRIFFSTNNLALAGGNLGTVTFQTDPTRFICGGIIAVSITDANGAGQQQTTMQKDAACGGPNLPVLNINPATLLTSPIYGPDQHYIDVVMQLQGIRKNAPIRVIASSPYAKVTFRDENAVGAFGPPYAPPDASSAAYTANNGCNQAGYPTGSYCRVGPDDGAFALWTSDMGGPSHERITYTMNFAPDCSLAAGQSKQIFLKWYDADFGAPATQPSEFGFILVDDGPGGGGPNVWVPPADPMENGAVLGGNDSYGEMSVNVIGGHRYRWIWSGVARNNGVQVYMPYSEIASDDSFSCNNGPAPTCNLDLLDASGNPLPGAGTLLPNQPFQTRFTLTNAGLIPFNNYQPGANAQGLHPGNYDFPVANTGNPYPNEPLSFTNYLVEDTAGFGTYNHRYIRINYTFNVPPGGTDISPPQPSFFDSDTGGNTAFVAPGSVGTYDFDWGFVISGIGWAPVQCAKKLTVANPPPPSFTCIPQTPTFEIGVPSDLKLSGVNSTPVGGPAITITSITATAPAAAGVSGLSPMTVIPPGTPAPPGIVDIGDSPAVLFANPGSFNIVYTVFWTAAGVPTSSTCNGNVNVYTKPYVKAYGADVWAGSSIGGAACNVNASVYGFARGAGTTSTGASAQFGVTALININEFYSSSMRNAANIPEKGTTFSNQVAPTYGGNFGGACHTVTDYFTATRDPLVPETIGIWPGNGTPGNSGKRRYVQVGGVDMVSNNIKKGDQVALYVDGDVFIGGDITYANGGINSDTDLPFFAMIVRGSIYIGPGVRQIDGLYVAQPNGAAGGKIYTCAPSRGSLYPVSGAGNLYNSCQNQLSVNGALIANQVKLLRTFKSLKDSASYESPNFGNGAGTNAAEVINFTPELYIAPSPLLDPLNNTTSGTYDSITGLPPVF